MTRRNFITAIAGALAAIGAGDAIMAGPTEAAFPDGFTVRTNTQIGDVDY